MGTKPVQIEMMILEQDGCERFQERGLMLTPLAILYAGSLKKCIHSWGGVIRVNLRIHIYAANCAHSVSRGYADASIAWSIINAYCHLQLTELVVNTRSELRKFRGYDTS